MLTFLHAADIHPDSPLRGLSYYKGRPPQGSHSAGVVWTQCSVLNSR